VWRVRFHSGSSCGRIEKHRAHGRGIADGAVAQALAMRAICG
jgi:hypothetical protein